MGLETVVIGIIGIVGGSSGAALVVGYFNRNKTSAESETLKAEATRTIREAASEMVKDYREDNKELRERLDAMERKAIQLQRELEKTQRRLETATYAFVQAVDLLRETGADVTKLLKYIDSQDMQGD